VKRQPDAGVVAQSLDRAMEANAVGTPRPVGAGLPEAAACVAMAGTILDLDESVTRQTISIKERLMERVLIGQSDEAYTGPMTAEQIESLRSIHGYIDSCIDNGLTFSTTLRELAREIQSLLHTPGSLPNVADDAAELEAMANDPDIQRELRAIEAESSGRPTEDPERP
jgi:hypothetical protein